MGRFCIERMSVWDMTVYEIGMQPSNGGLLVANCWLVLASALIWDPKSDAKINQISCPQPSRLCNTPGCISAANAIIQNMDATADPCEDFYQYACGGFYQGVSPHFL